MGGLAPSDGELAKRPAPKAKGGIGLPLLGKTARLYDAVTGFHLRVYIGAVLRETSEEAQVEEATFLSPTSVAFTGGEATSPPLRHGPPAARAL